MFETLKYIWKDIRNAWKAEPPKAAFTYAVQCVSCEYFCGELGAVVPEGKAKTFAVQADAETYAVDNHWRSLKYGRFACPRCAEGLDTIKRNRADYFQRERPA